MRRHWAGHKWGLIFVSFGLGIILTLILPLWGWRFLVGCAFLIIGWRWLKKC